MKKDFSSYNLKDLEKNIYDNICKNCKYYLSDCGFDDLVSDTFNITNCCDVKNHECIFWVLAHQFPNRGKIFAVMNNLRKD